VIHVNWTKFTSILKEKLFQLYFLTLLLHKLQMSQIALSEKQQATTSCTTIVPRDPSFSVWAGLRRKTKENNSA